MPDPLNGNRARGETALLIAAAMLITFITQRLYLHLINPNADFFVAGYNIHHLFTGILIEIPAAMALILGVGGLWVRRIACIAFGAGAAMMLDEVVYLIATDGSNQAYLTPVSLWGAVVLIGPTALLLVAFYLASQRSQ